MNTDFRQHIRDLMARKDIGIWATAKRAGISPPALYNYLNEKSQMTAGNLTKVIDALSALPNKTVSKES
jgi:predicted transcriptional regulator